MLKQAIDLPGVGNARELGGYAIGERRVKSGVLLRTAGLDRATPEAMDALQNRYRVKTVIDFRMSDERTPLPDPAIPGAENLHLPVLEQADMLVDVDPSMIEKYTDPNVDRMELFSAAYETGMLDDQLYVRFLTSERGRATFRGFFKALLALEDERAILWHCTDGKDRTGCAAMLLLFALGADRETVIRDYMLTNDYNAPRLSVLRQKIEPLGWPQAKAEALLFMSGGVSEVYMNNGINALVREYGTVEAYFARELDVGKEEREALSRKLLE